MTSKPFEFPAPSSMTLSQAAKWYWETVPTIPDIIVHKAHGDSEWELRVDELKTLWDMKSRLRLAAALALYSQDQVDKFFAVFPLPPATHFLGLGIEYCGLNDKAFELAQVQLLNVAEFDRRLFPEVVGDLFDGAEIF